MLGMEPVSAKLHGDFHQALNSSMDLAVAFFEDEPPTDRTPCLAVIPDEKISEILSWVHTFSPETFPLSQYCRVFSRSDWERIASFNGSDWGLSQRHRWASVVAGEMLAQADASVRLATIPLGWAQGCLSYAVARAFMIYGGNSPGLAPQVIQRIRTLADDSSLQRKRIGPRALSAVWSRAEIDIGPRPSSELVVAVVSNVAPQVGLSLRENRLLLHSSAEMRVQGFDQAADEAMMSRVKGDDSGAVGALLAGAAYLVGDGTSHIDLLEPYARECPEAYVWLGLLAGIAGPHSWDSAWMRLVKGVDRLMMGSHSLTDFPQADLSWVEYEWMTRLAARGDEYARLPKQSHRSLNIELFPNVSCQYRFASMRSQNEVSSTAQVSFSREEVRRPIGKQSAEQPKETFRLKDSVRLKAFSLLAELEQLLIADASPEVIRDQSRLFDDGSASRSTPKKRSPTKKATKGS
jgi:hypothetical protein